MQLVLAQSALEDLQALRTFYADQGVPENGTRLINDILTAVERLRDHPDSGRKVPEFDQDPIREIIFPPFRVVYLREPSPVSVIRVWREERKLILTGDEE